MHIEYSGSAIQQIQQDFINQPIFMKLVMDTEGCGCALNGVPALWIIDQPESSDIAADSSAIPTFYVSQQAFLFDDHMKISLHEQRLCYVLSSPQQIYHSSLPIKDMRK
jgi:uncharacterized protein YqkB